MDEPSPRPPFVGRIPETMWTLLLWCACAGFALVVSIKLPHDAVPVLWHPPRPLHAGAWTRAGIAVAIALPLCFARRWPVTVLVMLLIQTLVATLLGYWSSPPYVAADVLVGFITAVRPPLIGVAAAAATLAVGAVGWALSNAAPQLSALGVARDLILPTAVAWVIGNSIRQRRDYTETLHRQSAAQAVVAERLRIARELHDMVAHSIGTIAIQAGVGSRVIDTQPGEARSALRAIEVASRETLAGLRTMLGALREAASEPAGTAPAPRLADLGGLVARTADAGVRVDVQQKGRPRPLTPEIELAGYRIIQEALTNVVSHAGTDHCRLVIEYGDRELAIEVVDQGRGCATTRNGYGIPGMRERVELFHGSLAAGPRPGGGFGVAARIPA